MQRVLLCPHGRPLLQNCPTTETQPDTLIQKSLEVEVISSSWTIFFFHRLIDDGEKLGAKEGN